MKDLSTHLAHVFNSLGLLQSNATRQLHPGAAQGNSACPTVRPPDARRLHLRNFWLIFNSWLHFKRITPELARVWQVCLQLLPIFVSCPTSLNRQSLRLPGQSSSAGQQSFSPAPSCGPRSSSTLPSTPPPPPAAPPSCCRASSVALFSCAHGRRHTATAFSLALQPHLLNL